MVLYVWFTIINVYLFVVICPYVQCGTNSGATTESSSY